MHGVVGWIGGDLAFNKESKLNKHRLDVTSISGGCGNLTTWLDRRCDVNFIASLPKPTKSSKPHPGFGCAIILWHLKHRTGEFSIAPLSCAEEEKFIERVAMLRKISAGPDGNPASKDDQYHRGTRVFAEEQMQKTRSTSQITPPNFFNAMSSKDKVDRHPPWTCAGTIADLLVVGLTEIPKPVMSPQMAASWGYFDMERSQWDTAALEAACFPMHLLPEVRPCGEIVGKLAFQWEGIPAGADVFVALGDLQCSVYSYLLQEGTAACNLSTSAQIAFMLPKQFSPTTAHNHCDTAETIYKGHLDASSITSVATAGLCPRPQARLSRHAGDKDDPGCRRVDPPSSRHLEDADSATTSQEATTKELAQRLDNLPVAAASATADNEDASMENRWCKLWDTVQLTVLAVLGRARRQHQDWFDDNDAAIRKLFTEKNRLYKTYVSRPTNDNKAAFYLGRHLVQKRLCEMQYSWTTCKAKVIQGAINSDGALAPPCNNGARHGQRSCVRGNEVKQECVLAPTLSSLMFSAMLMDAYRDEHPGIRIAYRADGHLLNQRRKHFQSRVSTTTVQELLFADNFALNTTSEGDIRSSMDLFVTNCEDFSLIINTEKTTVMHQSPYNTAYAAS
nr:unnamed protein product [Spirometra erinaceieuropaei]